MILHILTQQLLAQSFLGGSGQDLARYYLLASKRSVVCSERVVKSFGPNRFSINDNDHLVYPVGTLFKITHNSILQDLGPDPKAGEKQRRFPNVDCISSTILPLSITGLAPGDSDTQAREAMNNPSTLSITPATPFTKALIGKGSGSIGDLVNAGISKPINFPILLGRIWFSCSMVQVSELDFLNAVAQVADCKLINKPDSYTFVPDGEKIRTRFLNSYKAFGDQSDTLMGIKQRLVYRGYELATTSLIEEAVSNPKMHQGMKIPDDKELKQYLSQLIKKAIADNEVDENPAARELTKNIDPKGEITVGYGYAFKFYAIVPLKNGRVWLI